MQKIHPPCFPVGGTALCVFMIVLLLSVQVCALLGFTFFEMEPSWIRYMWWVYLIGLVWTSEFILSCQQMVIAGAVAQWVFAK